MRMAKNTHVFQISGITNPEEKRIIIRGILKLGGKYISGSVYQHVSSHLIVPHALPSEKFLAACAAGKWVVTPSYVLQSEQNGSWLSEEQFEVVITTRTKSNFYPSRHCREKVSSGKLKGAFQGWRVLLMIQEPSRRAVFSRILKAGMAKVFHDSSHSHAAITHLFAKPFSDAIKCESNDAPCYPVTHIVQHLFGKHHVDINFKLNNCEDVFASDYKFEQELKDYIIQHNNRPRLSLCEFVDQDMYSSQPQATDVDFSQVAAMIECGLYSEAVSTMTGSFYLFRGLLPPAECVVSLLEHAQQGSASTVFLENLRQFFCIALDTNPPWAGPESVKKFYLKVLQCPCCKAGLWPFLESCICYCLLKDSPCHPLPGPALPTLFQFHNDFLAFIVTLFKGELYAISTRLLLTRLTSDIMHESARGSLILSTFWTVWERSTLLSSAVKRLMQLLVDAASKEKTNEAKNEELLVTEALVGLLTVVVEFWCHHNLKLNQALVDKGLKDFAEHFAVIGHKLPPSALVKLVVRIGSSRMKLAVADSVFRFLCCRNGYSVGDDPLCVKKIVQQYLPALNVLSQSEFPCETSPVMKRENRVDRGTGRKRKLAEVPENDTVKGNKLKGLKKVNAAGETLLHRACKRNQVDTVLKILALPDCDVNIQDHAGWTPLHEACNHGSTGCVQALLRHYPPPVVNSQVGGVSPLHDALLNGHIDIAKLLLEHGGSVILQQKDHRGRTPLELVSDTAQREQLLGWALAGETTHKRRTTEVRNLDLLEVSSFLLCLIIVSYETEMGLGTLLHRDAGNDSLRQKMLRALKTGSFDTVTSTWTDHRAVRLLGDVQTLMDFGRGSFDGQLSQPIRKCKGQNTQLLMGRLDELRSEGDELLRLCREI